MTSATTGVSVRTADVVEGVAVVVEVPAPVAAADTSGDASSSLQAAAIRTRAALSNVSLEVARITGGTADTDPVFRNWHISDRFIWINDEGDEFCQFGQSDAMEEASSAVVVLPGGGFDPP